MAVTELGVVTAVDARTITTPYEVVSLGLPANMGQVYSSATTTGDNTTLASAYTSISVATSPPNIIRPVTGIRMPHGVKSEFYYILRIPAGSSNALTNGVTFELMIAMDPNANDADLGGTKAYFDIVGTFLNSGGTAQGALATGKTPDDSSLGTLTCIAAQTAALPTTVGQLYLHVMNVAKASLGASVAVGDWVLVRIRRLGDHQLDTNVGNIVFIGFSAYTY